MEPWHEPLVHRPSLSARSATALSRFIADTFVDSLLARSGLDPSVVGEIGENVRRRFGEREEKAEQDRQETASERVLRLFRAGKLDEKGISAAMERGERAFVLEAIAMLGGIKASAVQKAFSLASPKGVAAVCWKAGLPAALAHQLQLRLARIAPGDAVKPVRGDYAASEKDLVWQLEFLGA